MRSTLLLVTAVLLACGETDNGGGDSDAGPSGSSGSGGANADAGGASGSGTAGAAGAPPDPDMCRIDSDCGFGEIEHEILRMADCPCLFGCPFIPQNRETIERRSMQYEALCEPGVDGQGRPCPVDDCVRMPDGVCVEGTCGGARQ